MSIDINYIRIVNGTQYANNSRDYILNSLKNDLGNNFDGHPSYHRVQINGVDRDILIVSASTLKNVTSRKQVLCYPNESINLGDYINWKNKNWLCIEVELDDTVQSSGIVYQCNNTLTWQDESLSILTIPCVLQDKSSAYADGLETNKFFTLSDDQILITIPNNLDTLRIPNGKRFMFNNDNNIFKVTKIQDLVANGLIFLTMTKDTLSVNDRVDLGICDYIEPTTPEAPSQMGYSIMIYGDDTITRNYAKTYTAKVYLNGIEVFDKVVVFSLSNTNAAIVSVSGNSCVVKGSTIGSCVLKSELIDNNAVFIEKQIQIVGIL